MLYINDFGKACAELSGSLPGVEQQDDARRLWFQVPVPSAKWGFVAVWQVLPARQAITRHTGVPEKYAQGRYAVNFEISFVLTEEC